MFLKLFYYVLGNLKKDQSGFEKLRILSGRVIIRSVRLSLTFSNVHISASLNRAPFSFVFANFQLFFNKAKKYVARKTGHTRYTDTIRVLPINVIYPPRHSQPTTQPS